MVIIGMDFIECIRFSKIFQKSEDTFLKYGIAIASNKRDRITESMFIKIGKGIVKMSQVSAKDTNIVGMTNIGWKSNLSGLIFEITTEMSPSNTLAEPLLFLPEEMFVHVVCSLNHCENSAVVIKRF